MDVPRILSRAAPKSQNPPEFSGIWKNDLGSEMILSVQSDKISGRYKSAVSAQGPSIEGDISGYINGDLIAFCVSWPAASITAWVGQVISVDEKDIIKTLWQMTTNVEEGEGEPKGLWHSIFAGTDTFSRVEAKSAAG